MIFPSQRLFLPAVALSLLVSASAQENATFQPTIESLRQYECPEWFRDAKFGIWAHWTGYSVPGQGDWYARRMYLRGSQHYNYHVKTYGHPSEFGYKDVIETWKADKFDPKGQMKLFKRAGAKYFIALANHHDNFDLWDSKHSPWNSVNNGPKINFVKEWREAALAEGMRWGLTSHLERTWSWFQVAKGADKGGPMKGVPYDGADPKLEHIYLPAEPTGDTSKTQPKNATKWWRDHWYDRCEDLIDRYKPDLFYVDGGVPFPGDDQGATGLKMMAHLYNQNAKWHGGENQAVMCLKNWLHVAPDGSWGYFWEGIGTLNIERGRLNRIRKDPWQTDTSIGGWAWQADDKYRSTTHIVHELVDIVSKNGNLLLNVPHRPDGSFDDEALRFLEEMGDWMEINGESIYGTRPWLRYGQDDLRIVTKGADLYITAFAWPEDGVLEIPLLGTKKEAPFTLESVELLGQLELLSHSVTKDGLITVDLPQEQPCKHAWVFKLRGKGFEELSEPMLKRQRSQAEVAKAEAIKIWEQSSKRMTIPKGSQAIAGDTRARMWGIDAKGDVFVNDGSEIRFEDEKAIDIGAGGTDHVVIVTAEHTVKRRTADAWEVVSGLKNVSRVDVCQDGEIWALHNGGKIARLKGGKWEAIPGQATDIGCGAAGEVVHVGGQKLWLWNGSKWEYRGGSDLNRADISPKTGHIITSRRDGQVVHFKDVWLETGQMSKDVTAGQSNDDEVIGLIEK